MNFGGGFGDIIREELSVIMTEIHCMHVQHFHRISKYFTISHTKFRQWLTREHIKDFSHLMQMSTFETPHPKHGTNFVSETSLSFFLLWFKCCLVPHQEVLNHMSVVYFLSIAPAWLWKSFSFLQFPPLSFSWVQRCVYVSDVQSQHAVFAFIFWVSCFLNELRVTYLFSKSIFIFRSLI